MRIRSTSFLPGLRYLTRFGLWWYLLAWGGLVFSRPVEALPDSALASPSGANSPLPGAIAVPLPTSSRSLSCPPTQPSKFHRDIECSPQQGPVQEQSSSSRSRYRRSRSTSTNGTSTTREAASSKEMIAPRSVSYKANLVRPNHAFSAETLLTPPPNLPRSVTFNRLDSLQSAHRTQSAPAYPGDTRLASSVEDPELGTLQLQSPPNSTGPAPNSSQNQTPPDSLDPQTTQSQGFCPNGSVRDPELGCLYVDPFSPAPARQPTVYLIARFDYFRSTNIYSAIDPIDDGLARPGLSLYAAPRLGPSTFLTAAVTGNLVRYSTQTQINYNELQLEASIFQVLSPAMYGRLGWVNQRLHIASDDIFGLPKGSRFLNDHAIRLELNRRDQITQRLYLNTYYQLRVGFANPKDRSRIINSFIASLNYDIQPNLQLGLDYQFALATFTRQSREDQFQQIGIHLAYTGIRNTQLYLFAGYSFGRSNDPLVDFNGFVFGISLSTSLGLF